MNVCAEKILEMYREAIRDEANRLAGLSRKKQKPLTPSPEKLGSRLSNFCAKKKRSGDIGVSALSVVIGAINAGVLGFRVEGRENLRYLKGGAVTVGNHVHPMDCTMYKSVLRGRKTWFICLKENFEIPVVGHIVKALGAVPVEPNIRRQAENMKNLTIRLAAGDLVHCYPEGMLVPYYPELRRMWDGAFSLAARAGCPVVPMVLCQRKGKGIYRLKRKPCFTLRIGEPLYPDTTLNPLEARDKLMQAAVSRMKDMQKASGL